MFAGVSTLERIAFLFRMKLDLFPFSLFVTLVLRSVLSGYKPDCRHI